MIQNLLLIYEVFQMHMSYHFAFLKILNWSLKFIWTVLVSRKRIRVTIHLLWCNVQTHRIWMRRQSIVSLLYDTQRFSTQQFRRALELLAERYEQKTHYFGFNRQKSHTIATRLEFIFRFFFNFRTIWWASVVVFLFAPKD